MRILILLCCSLVSFAQPPVPPVTGAPTVYQPDLLPWPTDADALAPDLTEPTSNRVYDLHLSVSDCDAFDLILSTAGNYHMALTAFWHENFLPEHDIQNWYFTTSPPVSPEQSGNRALSVGNVALRCAPHVAVGPAKTMDALRDGGHLAGEPRPLFVSRGNVLLVRKGNPKKIRGLWDLARPDVRLATSNPTTEPGSFGNYAASVYRMAHAARGPAAARAFFDSVFNAAPGRWVVGARIHHREVPHLLYADQADVAPLFYHLARYVVSLFPETFEIVPLGGTVAAPNPLPGNQRLKMYAAGLNSARTPAQRQAQAALLEALTDGSFAPYLRRNYLDAP